MSDMENSELKEQPRHSFRLWAEFRAFITGLNRILPLYQRITAVEFSAEPLPRNAMGKLLRR